MLPHELNEDEKEDVQQHTFRGGPDRSHTSRKAITKYGTTDGCRACTAIKRMGHTQVKFNYDHSDECRQRIEREVSKDPILSHRLATNQQRMYLKDQVKKRTTRNVFKDGIEID